MSKSTLKVLAGIGGAVAGLGAAAFGAKKAVDYYKSSKEAEGLMQPNEGPTIRNEVVDYPEVQAYEERNAYEYGESPYNPYSQPAATTTNVESTEDEEN